MPIVCSKLRRALSTLVIVASTVSAAVFAATHVSLGGACGVIPAISLLPCWLGR